MNKAIKINRPNFSAVDVNKIEAQLDELIAACRKVNEEVAAIENPTWENFIAPQEEAHNELDLFWSPVSHLNSVMNSDELREAYNNCIPKLSEFHTEIGQNSELYNATVKLRESAAYDALSAQQQKALNNEIRDFELSGVSLGEKDKAQYAEIAQALSKLKTEYSDNVMDATNAWEKLLTEEAELAGLPESAVAAAKQRASQKDQTGYLLNLEFPVYYAVLTFADNEALRKEMYEAYNTRASDKGPHAGKYDNTDKIAEILKLRAEKAQLLGYNNYAELSVVPKMVESSQQVMDFLNDLASKAVPEAKREFAELEAFAKDELGMASLACWDVAYVSDKLKQKQYALSEEDLKPYFPASKAVPGMFEVVGKLFGLKIEQVNDVDVYHKDVQCYAITDNNGDLRGEFYLDNYARSHKRGGAWMDSSATRQELASGEIQLPIAYLTCNLTPPVGDEPALLTHMEVTTLFHEFGHGLHHMLTRMDTSGVSGISGVEWDAVELPSQFMENWCWERESLDMISGHYKTGEPLPDDLLNKLRDARNFQSAMQLVRQLEFAMFDMQVHMQATPTKELDINHILHDIRQQVAVLPYPNFLRLPHAFAHIFAGGYSAGYFSYKWAEVLSADAFSRFEEEGIFNEQAGKDFLEQVLEKGGSRDAMESFVAFRGREPKVDALLRHSGLAA
jgi:oligopeptidase A